jgi:hypothetical protein
MNKKETKEGVDPLPAALLFKRMVFFERVSLLLCATKFNVET